MNSLFKPFRLGPLELANRFVRSATHSRMAEPDGLMSAEEIELYRRLSAGGVGLIVTGHMYVRRDGQCSIYMLGVDSDDKIPALARAARAVRAAGPARLVGQINYGGANVMKAIRPPVVLAPSPREDVPEAREASADELEELALAYGAAARRLREAGFDGVQLHAAHGYFINQTLSPLYNRRADRFGGGGRFLFLQKVIQETRRAAGPDFPILMKLASSDGAANGLILEESIQAAKMAAGLGLAAVEVSGGGTGAMNARRIGPKADPAWPFSEGYFADAAAKFKAALDIPVVSVGGYRSLDAMRRVLDHGAADMVSMSRPFIREPGLIAGFRDGTAGRSGCISCNLCMERNTEALRCWAVRPTL